MHSVKQLPVVLLAAVTVALACCPTWANFLDADPNRDGIQSVGWPANTTITVYIPAQIAGRDKDKFKMGIQAMADVIPGITVAFADGDPPMGATNFVDVDVTDFANPPYGQAGPSFPSPYPADKDHVTTNSGKIEIDKDALGHPAEACDFMKNLGAHEFGHVLGLDDDRRASGDRVDAMDPDFNLTFDRTDPTQVTGADPFVSPSFDDRQMLRAHYTVNTGPEEFPVDETVFIDIKWERQGGDKNPLVKELAADASVEFFWTKEGNKHPGHDKYTHMNAFGGEKLRFFRPKDDTITDWKQSVFDGEGEATVTTGNLKQESPFTFAPLEGVASVPWRAPIFAGIDVTGAAAAPTIYTAIDLNVYLAANPLGPLGGNYFPGQTLDGLGLTISGGVIPGVAGLYFATTDFVLDPGSPTGWVPVGGPASWLESAAYQSTVGPIYIIAIDSSEPLSAVPEPSTHLLGLICLLVLYGCPARRRRTRNR